MALRQRTETTASESNAIARLFQRNDWAVVYLRLIEESPGTVSTDLAARAGVERLVFKQRVRRLKALGLTESLEVGYRLSPRGQTVLADLENPRSQEDPMTDALARLRADVSHADVVRAIEEYDRLGPAQFFAEHGFGPSRTYELIWNQRHYPHKAILGTAYELATGQRLGSGDFEGGKSGAVAVLTKLGFTIQNKP